MIMQRSRKRKIVVTLTAVCLMAALLAARPQAASSAPVCDPGLLCLYEDRDGGGRPYYIRVGEEHRNLGWFNDKMSSWQNNTDFAYCWYFDANFGHPTRVMLPHGPTRIINLTGDENDKASSVAFCR
jgi:hypothetical protein